MLCFVIALKSKAVSKNWDVVSQLFEDSLRSAYHQIDPDFKIIAVCHETPQLHHTYDNRVEIINVDFLPPPSVAATDLTMQDKWKKIAVGMVRAREFRPDFVMLMDADDLVSCHLSQYVNAHKEANGWILKQGYRYRYGSRWIYLDDHFNCGTNAIVSSRLIQFPLNTSSEEISKCVVLTHGHTVIEQHLRELGTPLEPLPFLGAVYTHSHGDNWTDTYIPPKNWYGIRHLLGGLRRTRPLTHQVRDEFSIVV
ncbi:MAG: hypothetical protein SFY66_04230 [Oculatellaceae cyanobacterium bins.114]|nr:hypothetical protein [Oculatellaceae cyanobacterium bins.114]